MTFPISPNGQDLPWNFIVTRAPFRISFAGGGTDLPAFYEQNYGAVLNSAIDKYVYVVINQYRPLLDRGIDDPVRYRIRLSYATTENVHAPDELQHPIVREALKLLDLDIPMDIATMADVPAGTGLGSSSAFTVALLHALHLVKGERPGPAQLASEAANLEIDILGRPVGKQDHYAAAYGGLNMIEFLANGDVDVQPTGSREFIERTVFPGLMLLYTGVSRDSSIVLAEQQLNTPNMTGELITIRDHAHELRDLMSNDFSYQRMGKVLHGTWMRKRDLASGVTNSKIDSWYEKAMDAGAIGGKISGAGGGGFLLLVVDPERRTAVRKALQELPELSVNYEPSGSHSLLPSA